MSMFERFQKAGYPVTMLKTQYRMHPEVRLVEFHKYEFMSKWILRPIYTDTHTTEILNKKFRCYLMKKKWDCLVNDYLKKLYIAGWHERPSFVVAIVLKKFQYTSILLMIIKFLLLFS